VIQWEPWRNLEDRTARQQVSRSPGLYRVRAAGDSAWAYVGQSARLRGRLGDLQAVFHERMPLNDPHTAAPCLWALRSTTGCAYEFSVAPLNMDAPTLKAHECVAISEHRHLHGASPIANFGRMPDGWVKSSGNSRSLIERDMVRRGYPNAASRRSSDWPSILDSINPPASPAWAGLAWSPWNSLDDAAAVRGVYRIRQHDAGELVYVGQGNIRARLRAHLAKSMNPTHPQSAAFTDAEASWVPIPQASPEQLLEAECDLIASHVLHVGQAPVAQFRG